MNEYQLSWRENEENWFAEKYLYEMDEKKSERVAYQIVFSVVGNSYTYFGMILLANSSLLCTVKARPWFAQETM